MATDVRAAVLDDIAAQLRRDRKAQKGSPLYRIKREVIHMQLDHALAVEIDGITLTLTEAFTYHLFGGIGRMRLLIAVKASGDLTLYSFLASERFRRLGVKPIVAVPLADPDCFEALADGLARLGVRYTPPPRTP